MNVMARPPTYSPPATPSCQGQPMGAPPRPSLRPSPLSSPSSLLSIPPSSPSVDALFTRCGLAQTARQLCWDFIRTHYPTASGQLALYESPDQGRCSYTVCLGDSQILQFRPRVHQLNTTMASLARDVYGVFAPETRFLGVIPIPTDEESSEPLFVYSMTRIPGISLTNFRRNSPGRSAGELRLQRVILVRDFARFLSLAWKNRRPGGNLPFRGRLGGSLRSRLEMMRVKLPLRFRPVVAEVLKGLPEIEALPWVLTHGDVVPDNIMVEGAGGHRGTGWWPGTLRGLVDFAESEYLPFGVGLYGVEELFGQVVLQWDGNRSRRRFAYYPEAGDLRRVFWQELGDAIPPLATDRALRARVEQARLLGILLWHGFAFDDGKLNRVVQEGRDDEEIQKLDMFLFGSEYSRAESTPETRAATATSEKDWAMQGSKKQQPLVQVTMTETRRNSAAPRGWLRHQISKMSL